MSINTNDHTTALASGTVPTPEADTLPLIGNNSGNAIDTLPDAATVHLMFVSAYDALTKADIAVDVARQRIARLIMLRHEVSFSDDKTIPSLATLAMDHARIGESQGGVYEGKGPIAEYFDALCTEFMGEATFATSNHRKTFKTRIMRGFKLALFVSWNGGTFRDFDHDTGRLRVRPVHFVPFGYQAMPSLTHETTENGEVGDKIEYRSIGDDTGTMEFSITQVHSTNKPERMNLSIAQYNYATAMRIKHYKDPNALPAEATPAKASKAAKAQRAPATPASDNRNAANKLETDIAMKQAEADAAEADAKADKATVAALIAKKAELDAKEVHSVADMTQTELGITPTDDDAELSLVTHTANVNKALAALDTLLEHPQTALIDWPMLINKAQNGLINADILFTRLKAGGGMPPKVAEMVDAIADALDEAAEIAAQKVA